MSIAFARHAPHAIAHLGPSQVGSDAGETTIATIPVDGAAPESLPANEQDAVILVALPVILLVVGAVLHLVRRPPAGEATTAKGHQGGLVLMAVGGALTFAMLGFLMLAQ